MFKMILNGTDTQNRISILDLMGVLLPVKLFTLVSIYYIRSFKSFFKKKKKKTLIIKALSALMVKNLKYTEVPVSSVFQDILDLPGSLVMISSQFF